MSPAFPFKLLCGHAVRGATSHDHTGLFREIGSRSDQHHRLYTLGLVRCHMKKRHATRADSHRPKTIHTNQVKQCEDIQGGLSVRELLAGVG
jgi:hypothetical protein